MNDKQQLERGLWLDYLDKTEADILTDNLGEYVLWKCEVCEGFGGTRYPAQVRGGEIVEEEEIDCTYCQGTGLIKLRPPYA